MLRSDAITLWLVAALVEEFLCTLLRHTQSALHGSDGQKFNLSQLALHGSDGQIFNLSLPFVASKLFPLPPLQKGHSGLLVQRDIRSSQGIRHLSVSVLAKIPHFTVALCTHV